MNQFNHAPTPRPRLLITQGELARLKELRKLKAEADALREKLAEALEAGAAIELGPLTIRIVWQMRQSFTRDNLTTIIGSEAVEDLEGRLPTTPARYVLVEPTRANIGPRSVQPRPLTAPRGRRRSQRRTG